MVDDPLDGTTHGRGERDNAEMSYLVVKEILCFKSVELLISHVSRAGNQLFTRYT